MSDVNKVGHGLGPVCHHGGLQRVCRVCDLEHLLSRYRVALEKIACDEKPYLYKHPDVAKKALADE